MGREKGNYNGKVCLSGGLRWGRGKDWRRFGNWCVQETQPVRKHGFKFACGWLICYLKKRPQQALNFLCEPQMQSCFIPGKGVVGSMKYQWLPILTKADNS